MRRLKQYYQISQVAGVSIAIGRDGSLNIGACEIVINNDSLSFVKKASVNTLTELCSQLTANANVSLNLSGKGVLQKRINRIEEFTQNNFDAVLPNGKVDDFYIQNFISGEYSFVSLIRKAEANQWIAQLGEKGFTTLLLSLGPFPVQNIMSQLNIYGEEIVFDGHIIKLDEKKEWVSCHYLETARAPFPLKVELEGINEKIVIAYAAAFQLLLSSRIESVQVYAPVLETTFKELQAKQKLKVNGVIVIVVFFMMLLFNLIVFTELNASNSQLSDQLSVSAQSTINLQGTEDQIKQKELVLSDLGWDENINKSELIDRLASLMPPELTWQELKLNPVDVAASRLQKNLVFNNRQISITGKSEKIIPVNEYIARIKTVQWVKNVQLNSYTFNNELNTGQFTIIINY